MVRQADILVDHIITKYIDFLLLQVTRHPVCPGEDAVPRRAI
jgi:hypothetical protein